MARTPNETTVKVLSNAPIPNVDLSGANAGSRAPATLARDGDGRLTATPIFDNPAPQGVSERERIDREDVSVRGMTREEAAAARAQVEQPERFVVVNQAPKRVQLPAPGQKVGGSSATLKYGKTIDPREYDVAAIRRQGVKLVKESQFVESDGVT